MTRDIDDDAHLLSLNRLSLDAQTAVLTERLDNYTRIVNSRMDTLRADHLEFKGLFTDSLRAIQEAMAQLNAREYERNGAIARLIEHDTANEERWATHTDWSNRRAAELKTILDDRHDGSIRRGVWASQIRIIAASGLGGSLITALAKLILTGSIP